MFKTNNEIISIEAKATDPIPTGVVFWSHDKGTAKLIIQLIKEHLNQTLPQGTIVPILLEFLSATAENGRGRHIYHAVIEDAINGIVSIVLEDNILGYQGKVDGSIYIELPDKRSLDTAGRFSFEIKRSPIDEEVPELEDYYWQGFNEIMESYHQTIAGIKLEAKELLDSLKQDVSSAQEKVSQLEQSISTANTNFNARIDEISKKIDENDVYTKAESSANVIDQISGKETNKRTLLSDFKNKVSGSTVENPNSVRVNESAAIPSGNIGGEITSINYGQLAALDGTRYPISNKTPGNRVSLHSRYDIVEIVERLVGSQFFEGRGANDLASKIEVIKTILKRVERSMVAYGSSPTGYKLISGVRNATTVQWINTNVSTASEPTLIKTTSESEEIQNIINSTGHIDYIDYTEVSDGVTYASIYTDYTSFEIELDLSANEHIKSMIAQYHRDNIATQDEAESGESNEKIMTPQTTKQSIEKHSVLLTGNQDIDGEKNFLVTPTANNKKLLTVDDYSYSKNLYKGAMYFTDTNSIPFSMNDVKTGLVFVLGRYNSTEGVLGTGFYTHIIRKEAFTSRLSKEFRLTIADTYKSIFISNGLIKGEVDNYNDATKRLFAVVEVNAI